MCKNTFLIGIKNPINAYEFMITIAPLMSKFNNDGMGYVAVTPNGFFAERFLFNQNAFCMLPFDEADIKLANDLGCLVDKKTIETSNKKFLDTKTIHGETEFDKMTSVLLHARKSTGSICLENVHPFIIDQTALVHNGVISNDQEFTKTISTCDSEAILFQYLNHEINEHPEKISMITETLLGWYACGVTSKDKTGKRIIDIFKSDRSQLFVTSIPEIGGYCFSTSQQDITDTLNTLGWSTMSAIFPVQPKVFTRFDAITGEILFQTSFKEMEIKPVVSKKSRKSYKTVQGEAIHPSEEDDFDYLTFIYDGLSYDLQQQVDQVSDSNISAWCQAVWLRRYQSSNFHQRVS